MKKLLFMINFELRRQIRYILILIACMIAVQAVSFLFVAGMEKNRYLRFEELLELSGVPVLFYSLLIIALIFSAFSFYRDFFGGKSIYALLTLPQRREFIFVSKVVASVLSIFLLWAAQLVSIFICHEIYIPPSDDIPRVHNALLLAFARSDFLRSIFPFDPLYFPAVALMTATLVIFVLFAAMAERSHRYAMIFIPLPWVLLALIFDVFPLYESQTGVFTILAAVAILDIVLIRSAIRILKTGAFG